MLTCLPRRGRWPAGPEGASLAATRNISDCREALSPTRCGGSPLAEGAKDLFRPQRLAEHLQTLVQELFGLGEKAQAVDIQRAFHAGGVTAAQQQRRKGAADLTLLEVAAQAPGLFLAGKDDLGLTAVGVLFGSL